MRIGFVSQWYPPESGAAALPGTQASALAAAGHDVTVVTGFPNYPLGELISPYRMGLHRKEVISGVTVHRAPLYVSHDRRPVRRFANYGSFALSASMTALATIRDVDAVWVHATPATAALPAIVLRNLGIPYVLHVQDLWPDTVTASEFVSQRMSRCIELVLHPFCDFAYRRAFSVQVIAPGMVEQISARGVPRNKIGFIPNWCDETVFKPKRRNVELQTALGLPNGFSVMYAGAIGHVQGLDIVIEAADLLRSRPEINFVLIGSGVARDGLMWEAAQRKLSNVHFVPAQAISAMGDILALGDVQLICLRDLPLYRITLPSKVQATMAAGCPLIVSAGGDAAKVVEDARAGIAVPPGSTGELARAVIATYEVGAKQRRTWGNSARDHYLSKYSESVGVAAMLDALAKASDNRRVAQC